MPIALIIFAFVFATILGGYWGFVVVPEQREEHALRKRMAPVLRTKIRSAIVKPDEKLSTVGGLHALLAHREQWLEPLRRLILRSGLKVTIGAVLLASTFAALVAGVGIVWLLPSDVFGVASILPALAGAAAAAQLPLLFLRWTAGRRMLVFEEQFPEAIDLMARALRAGHAMTTSLQMVADEIPPPVGGEFATLFEQQNYGMSMPEALRAFAARVPIVDARFFVTALLTQRESGGNLSDILDRLAAVIRERFRVKRQVRVMSAHGRITGVTLSLLPIAVAAALLIVSPQHVRLLIDDPLGIDMVGTAVVLQVIGVVIIRRIVNVEY